MSVIEFFYNYLKEIYGSVINLIIIIKEKYLIAKEKILNGELYGKVDEFLSEFRGDNFFTYTLIKSTNIEKKTEVEVIQTIQEKKDL
jgi:hypothetical protein